MASILEHGVTVFLKERIQKKSEMPLPSSFLILTVDMVDVVLALVDVPALVLIYLEILAFVMSFDGVYIAFTVVDSVIYNGKQSPLFKRLVVYHKFLFTFPEGFWK